MTALSFARKIDLSLPGMIERSASLFGRVLRARKSFARGEEGAIAVEFALLSPLLVIGLLYTGLYAVQVHRRLEIEQIVRAGAEIAVRDPGNQEVFQRMAEAALAKGYSVWSPWSDEPRQVGDLSLVANRTCFCPGVEGALDCRTICAGGRPTAVRYLVMAHQQLSALDDWFQHALGDLRMGSAVTEIFVPRIVLVR
jgi:Flp pilus assembly pilin Flp